MQKEIEFERRPENTYFQRFSEAFQKSYLQCNESTNDHWINLRCFLKFRSVGVMAPCNFEYSILCNNTLFEVSRVSRDKKV